MCKYSYCYGIIKDDNWMEHECPRRDDCQYYLVDNMSRYYGNPDYEMFFPPIGMKCPHFVPKEKEEKKQDFVSPFG